MTSTMSVPPMRRPKLRPTTVTSENVEGRKAWRRAPGATDIPLARAMVT